MENFERFQFIQIVHDIALKALTDENTPKVFFDGFIIRAHKMASLFGHINSKHTSSIQSCSAVILNN